MNATGTSQGTPTSGVITKVADHLSEMWLELDGRKWIIRRCGSMFTARNNAHQQLEDVNVRGLSNWTRGGSLEADGNIYTLLAIVAVESGEVLRDYGLGTLPQLAIDAINTMRNTPVSSL